MSIRGYIGKKFDHLCQISSVYGSNTASFYLTTVIYVILLQLAYRPPSCAQGVLWHSYCAEVLSGPRGCVCSDAVLVAQNSGDICLKAACSEKCLQAVQMSLWRIQDWISAVLRISFAFTYFPEIFSNSWFEQSLAEIIFLVWDSLYTSFINTGILCNQRPALRNSWIHFGLTRGMGIFLYIFMALVNIQNAF